MAPNCTLADCVIPADAPFEDIINLLTLRGGIVIKGLLDPKDALAIKTELQPMLDAQAPDKRIEKGTATFFPPTTRKVCGLITKSETFARKIVINPTLVKIAKELLHIRNKLYLDTERVWCNSAPIVNVTTALEIHPGATSQALHRDDYTYNRILPHADTWSKGRELSILTFTACTKVTPENGGTWFIPGSHLWGEEESKPSFDDALRLEMDIGDTFVMLCSCFHAGGTNSMEEGAPNSVRTLVALGYCQGTLRQEENQFLALDHAKLAKLPREVAELAGWSVAQPNVGNVNFEHPLNLLGYNVPVSNEHFYGDPIPVEPVH